MLNINDKDIRRRRMAPVKFEGGLTSFSIVLLGK
jgi:hypothetical protein